MKDLPVQINEKMSIFDNASVEKQIKHRDSVVKVDANFLRGTPAIADDERGPRRMTSEVLSLNAVTTGPATF